MFRDTKYSNMNRAEAGIQLLYDAQGHALRAHDQPALDTLNARLLTAVQARDATIPTQMGELTSDTRFSPQEKLMLAYALHEVAYEIGGDALDHANVKLVEAIQQNSGNAPRP